MLPATHSLCKNCGLVNPKGEQTKHLSDKDCIRALRDAMQRQRLAAEDLGMDMSLHFLRVFEELSLDPEVGVQYGVWDPEAEKMLVLPGQQVSGIFAAMLRKYQEVANFSPHEREVGIGAHWARVAGLLAGEMIELLDRYKEHISKDDAAAAQLLIDKAEATQPGGAPPDPSGS